MVSTHTATIIAAFLAVAPPTLDAQPSLAIQPPLLDAQRHERTRVELSVGSFRFIGIEQYAGPVTWDWPEEQKAVRCLTIPAASFVVGIKQGEQSIGIHRAPDHVGDVLLVVGAEPGRTNMAAWGVQQGRAVRLAAIEVVVQGAQPPPVPEPVPPQPVGKLHHWVLVEETRQAAANRGATIVAATQWSKANQVRWAIVDQDVIDPATGRTPADLDGYVRDAKKQGLPWLFLCDAEGRTIWQGKPPADGAAYVELFQKYWR